MPYQRYGQDRRADHRRDDVSLNDIPKYLYFFEILSFRWVRGKEAITPLIVEVDREVYFPRPTGGDPRAVQIWVNWHWQETYWGVS